MQVEVHINKTVVHTEPTTGHYAMQAARQLFFMYHMDELHMAGVTADVYISGVQSKMNSDNFLVRPEVYDELYFKETVE